MDLILDATLLESLFLFLVKIYCKVLKDINKRIKK